MIIEILDNDDINNVLVLLPRNTVNVVISKTKDQSNKVQNDYLQYTLDNLKCLFKNDLGNAEIHFIEYNSGDKIKGLRPHNIVFNKGIDKETQNIVSQGFRVVCSDPIKKIREAALKRKKLKDNEK